MRIEDIQLCVKHGADIIGFVVEYPVPVPWNLNAEEAKKLIAAVPKPTETCIVVGGERSKILRLALTLKPNYVQLHGDETVADTAWLVNELKKHEIKIIKAIFANTSAVIDNSKDFCEAGVHALLLDSRTPNNAECGGEADINVFAELQNAVSCPVVLAGGLTPENVSDIIGKAKPQIIDLMTGVESRRGVKDEERIISFFKSL
jgi:phosphoribosylanthranilate isomerase